MTTGKVPPGSRLLMRRFGSSGPPVLLIHGLGQNGDIFCPAPDSGLAPWLEQAGYSVHVADLRTRDAADQPTAVSQHQLITEDLPVVFQQLAEQHPGERFFIVSHGWGGVLVSSALIRQPQWLEQVAGLVQIAVRRRCQQRHWRRRLLLDLMWGRLAPLLGRSQQVLALRALGLGRVDISRRLHDEVRMWQNDGNWRDPQDGFDYAASLAGIGWPDSLYIAGHKDQCMGHPADITLFIRELGVHDAQLILLQKGTGSSRDYGHGDLLTHPSAAIDHFPILLSWLTRHAAPDT